jgi:hypothetical protein
MAAPKPTPAAVILDALDHLACTAPARRDEVQVALRALGQWHDHDPEDDCPEDCPTLRGPAERWETITAEQVRVGDDIEVTREWDGGRIVSSGVITEMQDQAGWRLLTLGKENISVGAWTPGPETIRRRVRPPMPEPESPAVVRHAGRVYVRSEYSTRSTPWYLFAGPLVPLDDYRSGRWLGWPEVLALDPTTDPVVVDLGGNA